MIQRLHLLFLAGIMWIGIPVLSSMNAQVPDASWSLIFDGHNTVELADLVVDNAGNTFAALNYSSELTIPGIQVQIPRSNHMSGLILNINPKGKVVWAYPFTSPKDNRIRDLALAPNGDLLVSGFGDAVLEFHGKNESIKVGQPAQKVDGSMFRHNQGLYVARYSTDGEQKWVQYFECGWGEALSSSANSKGEVFTTFYHKGDLKRGEEIIATYPSDRTVESQLSMAKFNAAGELQEIKPLKTERASGHIVICKVLHDAADNLILYGTYRDHFYFTEKDSLHNDGYYESLDSYIAKYSPEGELLWSRSIGGRNAQVIQDVVIGPDNTIYATGRYYFECIISTGITVPAESTYEYKSGSSLFYLQLVEDGELLFADFASNDGYSAFVEGRGIAIDKNSDVHIVGGFNNTLQLKGFELQTPNHIQAYYSRWKRDSLTSLDLIGKSPKGFMHGLHVDANGYYFSGGAEYVGDDAHVNLNGRKVNLSNDDYGRNVVLFGGEIPPVETPSEPLLAMQPRRVQQLEMMLECISPEIQPSANVWFPQNQEVEGVAETESTPCGYAVDGLEATLYPNPTMDELNIKLVGLNGGAQMEVFTTSGQLLFSRRIEAMDGEQIILMTVSDLYPGTYLVRIRNHQYQKVLRFVKMS